MSTEHIVAIASALAAVLGAWLEVTRGRRDREHAQLSERLARHSRG